jgi:CheY-like chemotaxis protein
MAHEPTLESSSFEMAWWIASGPQYSNLYLGGRTAQREVWQKRAVKTDLSARCYVRWPTGGKLVALVLLIDDDEFYCRVIERELSDAGFAVVSVLTGAEGIARYRELLPDLVITDMHMPEMGGAEVIKCIRAIDKRARIIAVSGAATFYSVNFFKLAKEVGADAVIRKLDPLDRIIIEANALLKVA